MAEVLELQEKAFTKGSTGISETLLGTERVLRAQLLWLAARGDYLRARALVDRAIGAWSA
jgi:outer membrane protein TolC